MRRLIYILIAVLLCFTTLPEIHGQVVGSIPGQFNVGSSGAASYTIPIDCPAGINGMQPNISLVYNSQSGNGPLGVGWEINGLSSISRRKKNVFSDNVLSGNVLHSNQFALDGNRLKIKNSANWETIYGSYFNDSGDGEYPPSGTSLQGDTYETENKTDYKIEAIGTNYTYTYEQSGCNYIHGELVGCTTTDWSATPGEPNLFKVTTKEGLIIEYAMKHGLQTLDNGALEWLMSKITDQNGNYMTFTYQFQGDGQLVIQKIEYTGNGARQPFESIVFNYTNKITATKTYIDGAYIEDKALLNNIQVKTGNTTIKQYNLDYNYQKEKYFLKNIELIGQNNEKLNSTIIQWGEDNGTIGVQNLPVPPSNYQAYISSNNVKSWFSDDLNGDGLTDLYSCFKETQYGSDLILESYICSLNSSGKPVFTAAGSLAINDFAGLTDGSFFALPSPTFKTPPITYADFSGDGKKVPIYPKWIGGPSNAYYIYINGKTYGYETCQVSTEKPAYSVADINNDGIDEIITVEKGVSSNKTIMKIRYSKSESNYSWKVISLDISSAPKDIIMQDFNGDGLPDLLIATANGIVLYKNNGGAISADNYATVSFTPQSSLNTFNANYSAIKLGDFNGDGLVDFILNEHCNSNWKLALNNGNWNFSISSLTNFTATEESFTDRNNDKEDCIVTDFNHDGKADVILVDAVYVDPSHWYENSWGKFQQTNVTWYASTGTGFTVAKNFTTTNENYTFSRFNTVGDFDGDGREELFTYGSDLYNNGSTGDNAYIHSSPNTNFEASLVKSITNGFGNKMSFTYQPLTYNTTPDNRPFYTRGNSSTYPVLDFQLPFYCVSKVAEPDGQGGLNTTEFAYSEARTQLTGRGFLGFKTQTVSNSTTNRKIVSTTDMNLTYYLPDKETTEISTTGGTAVSKTENYYMNSKTGSIFLSQPSQTVESDYLSDLTKTTNYLSFDAYGNATCVKTTQGDLITTQNSSYVQKGSWCPNKPETVSITRQQSGDTNTRTKTYTYDDKGNLTKEISDPSDANQLTIEYKNWNVFGQPTKTETTANGILRSMSNAFTPSGRFKQSQTDVQGQTTTYSWDETRGVLNSETNRIGTTTYTYNGFGQLTNTLYPDGTQKSQTALWASTGNAFGAKYYITQQVSGSAANYTWFDALQREVVREGSGLKGNISRIFTQYRADGKTYRVSAPTFDTQATAWDAVYDYYPEGRLKTVTTPVGTITTTYSSKTTTVTSPEGTRATTLNAAGQTATSTVNDKTVTYAYHASGKVKTATPAGSAAVSMEYDLQGNRTKLTDPDAGVSSAGYNGYGELKWEKQTNNAAQGEITTTYNYNAATGQIESRVRNSDTTSYGYDTYRRLGTVEIVGLHKQTYTYGDYDRVTALTELINGTKTLVKGLEYDAYGRIYKETFPSGYYTVNNYDSYGNLNEVTDKYSRSIWKATEANARGQFTRVSKGDIETVYGYDEAKGQLTSMVAAGVASYSYSYDAKNNLEYRCDNLLEQKDHYIYDSHNRLTNWDIMNRYNTVLKPNSMIYDATTGNIAAKSDLNNFTMNYGEGNGKPHALTTIMGKPDAISASDLNITYTDFRKIKTLTEGSKQYTISYGVDDQRRMSVQTQGGTSLTKYYFGNYEEETDQLGNVKKIHYLSGGSQLINLNGVETLYYGYTDNQGSLIALVNGNVVEKYAYDPWGARRNPDDWTQKDNRTGFLTNRGYTGHEHLDAFNIINMNGRVYDPLTAMFFSPDPFIQSADDWKNYNRYSYCMNNPTRYTDPSGYQQMPASDELDQYHPSFQDQIAEMERRMGISNGGMYGSNLSGWDAQHQGSISYNWDSGRYEYASGAEAGWGSAQNQLYSRTRPQDIQSYSGSNLGYDHLYTLNIGGQLRLAGSLGGEITGIKSGQFTVSNNGLGAVLAANSEAVVWGDNSHDLGFANNVLGAGGIAYAALENTVANKYWWMDAKGVYNSTKILNAGSNGKFIQGVQGLRNGYASALQSASKFKVAGNIVGGLGLGVTVVQWRTNQITGFEASIDGAFGIIGFMGPIGAGISATYFIGKIGYEYFSGNTLFVKPQ